MIQQSGSSELVELQVYALVVDQGEARPLLLMKDKVGGQILPIPLSVLEAQILAFGSDRIEGAHGVSLDLIKMMGAKIEKAQFREIKANRQILDFYCSRPGQEPAVIEAWAECSISLALGAKAPILATTEFIDQCRRAPLSAPSILNEGFFSGDKIPPHLIQ